MASRCDSWETRDFAKAMENAIRNNALPRLLHIHNEKIHFNGFWRKGDKQNVCMWLDKASWHDAKTGEGGGCKEFAKTAFNMSLPEFMERFGSNHQQGSEKINLKEVFKHTDSAKLAKPIHEIWIELQKRDLSRPDNAASWLNIQRGITKPRFFIGSGFTNLDRNDVGLFEPQHHGLINYRISLGHQLIAPIRGVHSDQVQNLFIRAITDVPKEEKSRLLTDAGGWSEADKTPRAFGFPHLIHDFPNLILCEGMVDYFAAEQLLDGEHKFLPIGVGSASALPKWAEWLAQNQFRGCAMIIFHLDQDKNGNLSDTGVGQDNAVKCVKNLQEAGVRAKLFPWLKLMKHLNDFMSIRDLADVLKLGIDHDHVQGTFLKLIHEEINAN